MKPKKKHERLLFVVGGDEMIQVFNRAYLLLRDDERLCRCQVPLHPCILIKLSLRNVVVHELLGQEQDKNTTGTIQGIVATARRLQRWESLLLRGYHSRLPTLSLLDHYYLT